MGIVAHHRPTSTAASTGNTNVNTPPSSPKPGWTTQPNIERQRRPVRHMGVPYGRPTLTVKFKRQGQPPCHMVLHFLSLQGTCTSVHGIHMPLHRQTHALPHPIHPPLRHGHDVGLGLIQLRPRRGGGFPQNLSFPLPLTIHRVRGRPRHLIWDDVLGENTSTHFADAGYLLCQKQFSW